jgi:hypothetical protein
METEKRMQISDDRVTLEVVTFEIKVQKECWFLDFHDAISTFRDL